MGKKDIMATCRTCRASEDGTIVLSPGGGSTQPGQVVVCPDCGGSQKVVIVSLSDELVDIFEDTLNKVNDTMNKVDDILEKVSE